ncbi:MULTISPECIES: co-chaperone GroES [unclassified Fusibacter]|uniref:co-chaperone GroES n=1 Tax=unclassified Fusibacter TaxID=2624464 RepID=UPI001012759F|nr:MULTISPECIES: co-chaperone GroES [unclassified Fusibacter]MCK8059458.1 co-chaperone GroES [Fusibacter sp. A2]NPE21078.1 co-chaperone GroES [Fusibacter sp. A1]RXV62351.1 co-chaperone GroES [Fusibacter sp. A1]
MKIRPLGERVVIKRVEAEEKTASGIVLPGQAKEQPQIAEVVEIPLNTDAEFPLSVGDRVIFKQYSGSDVKIGNDTYTVIDVENILAIVE